MPKGMKSKKNTSLSPIARTRVESTNGLAENTKSTELTSVKKIKVNGRMIDEDKFVNLIKNKECNDVERLQLKNVTFDQQFYDQLPDLCKINYLEVESNDDINCDFVLKFQRLKYFSINQHLSPEFMGHLISNNADDIEEIGFKYHDHKAEITLLGRDDYSGRYRDTDLTPAGLRIGLYGAEFDDLDNLFGFLKNIL